MYSGGERNVLRTYHVAAAAADAHVIAESLAEIKDLVKNLEAHSLALGPSVLSAAGHVGVAVHHAGSADSSSLADLSVLCVIHILHCVAGAGGTYEIAAAAADAAHTVLIPYGALIDTVGNLCGNRDTRRVLCDVFGLYRLHHRTPRRRSRQRRRDSLPLSCWCPYPRRSSPRRISDIR